MLQSTFLNLALKHLCFKPKIDLFATNINTQIGKYAIIRADSGALYIVTFSINWTETKFYAFSLISVIPRVLSEVKRVIAEGIVIVPYWRTRVWYPEKLKML